MQIQNTHVNTILTAVFTVVAIWLAAQLTWRIITPLPPVVGGPIAMSAAPATQHASVRPLIALNLFGAASADAPVTTVNAPRTSLNIRLLGVSASNVPERSAAIIERNGTQQVYGVGEKLEGTAVEIKEIYADKLLLDNNGRLETLELEGIGELSPGLSLSMSNSSNLAATDRPQTSRRVIARNRDAAAEASSSRLTEGSILDVVRVTPVRNGNRLMGYRLQAGRQAQWFEKVGFQDGDIAIVINGQDLTNVRSAMAITGQLGQLTEATVTVLRGNETVDIPISMTELLTELPVAEPEQEN